MSAGMIDFGAVPLDLLRRYLLAKGWFETQDAPSIKRRPSSVAMRLLEARGATVERNFDLFLSREGGPRQVELVVPRDRSNHEYSMMVERVIRALAAVEDRDELEVSRAIRQVGFDVVRSRVPDLYVLNDTIHLANAESFIKGIRNVLASTATTELDPKPYFLRVRKEATEYADRCRFGHTFRGSFGFTVESPLEPNIQTPMLDIPSRPPFERRVIERLARGLAAVSRAVATDSTAPIVASAQSGFSANVCEQLALLVEETAHAALAFEFSFSPEWDSIVSHEPGVDPEEGFVVGPQHVEAVRAAARELRRAPDPTLETVYGRVIKLASQVDPSNLTDLMGEREVDLLWSSETLGDVTVRTSLSPTDYLSALDAHRAGKPISLFGTLERKGRGWSLSEPTLLPPPSDDED